MTPIKPGTLCYLVRCKPENLGRVVEVVSPVIEADDGSSPWHFVDADWIKAMFPGQECLARPSQLMPISGLQPEAPGEGGEIPRKRPVVAA